MLAPSRASGSWTAPAMTRCGSPNIISRASASVRRCIWSPHWPRRTPAGCASAPPCRWRRFIIHCGSEEVALLDILSGGRVNWGAGRGFARVEFEAFGIPPQESASRFRETVEIVLQAWTHEKLHFAGQNFAFDGVEVLPKPLQKPHPPVWMAASSDEAIDWAAGRGFAILMDPHSTAAEIGRKRRRYRDKLAAAGFSEAGRDIPVARLVALADSAGKAAAVARAGAEWILNSYLGAQHRPVLQTNFTPAGVDPVRRYVDEVVLHGTPDAVADQIAALRDEIALDYLICAPLSHESFLLLTDKVLPRLA